MLWHAFPVDLIDSEFANIPGASPRQVPPPLLANMGKGGTRGYTADYQMMIFNNAQERTVGKFAKLGQESGWKMTSLNRGGHGAFASVIYIPV